MPHSPRSLTPGAKSAAFSFLASSVFALAAASPILLIYVAAGPAVGQVQVQQTSAIDLHELYYGAYLPRDRSATRTIQLADQLLDQERFSEAIPLLLRALDRREDSLDNPSTESATSLRRRARAQLAGLSPAGVRAYQLEAEAEARRLLQDALQSGEPQRVAEVFRRRPESLPAAEALWYVAAASLESGSPELALASLRRLKATPHAERFEPQLTLQVALALIAAGADEQAFAEVDGLAGSSYASARIAGVGTLSQPRAVFEALTEVGAGLLTPWDSWREVGGNLRANPLREGGQPHLWARWSAPTVVDPREEDQLAQTSDWLISRKRPLAPSLLPIAVGDLVVMRTGGNLVAIDWATGRRVWETRPEPPPQADPGIDHWGQVAEEQSEKLLGEPPTVRTWFDHVAGALASDGRCVLAIESHQHPARADNRYDPFGALGGRVRYRDLTEGNRLVAYDIATEGKLLWAVGGGSDPLADAYFLGAPRSVGGRLAVLAELDQAICLLQIDPASGELLWRQSLVSVERGIDESAMRRCVGAATAVSGEVIVCSTGVGVVAAIDLLDRSILWVDRFPVEEGRQATDAGDLPFRRRNRDAWPKNSDELWLENRLIIDGRRVVVASPESSELHCLDLDTGRAIWRAKRSSASYLMAVTDGVAIVGGAENILARDLETGAVRWRVEWPGDGVLSGRAVVASGRLLAPLSDGGLLVVDTSEGKLLEQRRAWSGGGLGNLVMHRGAVVSQTAVSLDRYDERAELVTAAEQRLQETPWHSASLCVLGEDELSAGRLDPAIARFRQAFEASPDSALARRRLREAVAMRLEAQGPNAEDLRLLASVVEGPEQRRVLQVRGVELALLQGKLLEAIERAGTLLDDADAEPMMHGDAAGHYALPRRRVAGLLADAWQKADEQQRASAEQAIASVRSQAESIDDLEAFAAIFGGLARGDEVRRQLAESMATTGRQLGQDFYDAADRLGQPASSSMPQTAPLDTAWATRQVAVQIEVQGESDSQFNGSRRRNNSGGWRSVVLIDAAPATGPPAADALTDLAVDLDEGRLIGTNGQGEVVYESDLGESAAGFVREVKSSDRASVWRFGSCLYFSTGEDVVALETLPDSPTTNRRLWSTEGVIHGLQRSLRSQDIWRREGEAGRMQLDPSAAAEVVSVGERGVLIRKGDALVCVDALTGVPQWVRNDVSFTSRSTANESCVYATISGGEGLKLSMIDGSRAGGWRPPSGEWLACRRGRLTTIAETGDGLRAEVVDMETGEAILQQEVEGPARLGWLDDWGLAMLGADGGFALVDMAAGVAVVETNLPLRTAPTSVEVALRGERLVVIAGYLAPPGLPSKNYAPLDNGAIISGDVFCLDRQTGEPLWPRGAAIEKRGWLERQPRESPLLLFGARCEERSNRRATVTTELLVLDVVSGRAVYREEDVNENATGAYRTLYRPGARPELALTFPRTVVSLRATDSPAPPSPPASDIVEGSPAPRSAGGLMQEVQQAIRGSIRLNGQVEDEDD